MQLHREPVIWSWDTAIGRSDLVVGYGYWLPSRSGALRLVSLLREVARDTWCRRDIARHLHDVADVRASRLALSGLFYLKEHASRFLENK